jgi:hypothetical protein
MHNISKCEVKQVWESFRGRIGHYRSMLGCQQHCVQGFPETKQKVSRHTDLPKPSNHVCMAEDESAFLQQKPIQAEWLLVSFILEVPRSFSAALPTALYDCVVSIRLFHHMISPVLPYMACFYLFVPSLLSDIDKLPFRFLLFSSAV